MAQLWQFSKAKRSGVQILRWAQFKIDVFDKPGIASKQLNLA